MTSLVQDFTGGKEYPIMKPLSFIFLISGLLFGVVQASIISVYRYKEDKLVKAADTLSDCNLKDCDEICRRLGFPNGICNGGTCYCINKESSLVFVDFEKVDEMNEMNNNDISEVNSCSAGPCEQLCSHLGLPGGACVNDKCDCNMFREYYEVVNDNDRAPSEMQDCSLRACEQLCRRLGFPGGACVNGKCDCDRFIDKEMTSLIEPLGCNIWKCNVSCIRRGHHGGICLAGKCKCL